MEACRNCGAPLTGAFCANCGQAAAVERITAAYIWRQVFRFFTHIEKGFLLTSWRSDPRHPFYWRSLMRRATAILAGLAGLAVLGCVVNRPMAGDWVVLGQRQVNDRADHDLIAVTSSRGDFRRIKITVQRASVDFHRVVVHFGNGGRQQVEMRNTIPAGGETRAIDLEGVDRVIRSVEFWYDANTIRGRRAQVRLLGLR